MHHLASTQCLKKDLALRMGHWSDELHLAEHPRLAAAGAKLKLWVILLCSLEHDTDAVSVMYTVTCHTCGSNT